RIRGAGVDHEQLDLAVVPLPFDSGEQLIEILLAVVGQHGDGHRRCAHPDAPISRSISRQVCSMPSTSSTVAVRPNSVSKRVTSMSERVTKPRGASRCSTLARRPVTLSASASTSAILCGVPLPTLYTACA